MTQEKEKSQQFELILRIKDKTGNPTGKTRYFCSDSPEEVGSFWDRNDGQFWEGRDPSEPFLVAEIAPYVRSNKKGGSQQGVKHILLKKVQKLAKSNTGRVKDGLKIVTDVTIACAGDVINNIADQIRVKVRVLTNNSGAITLEFNSYNEGEQALEITILNKEVSYNFWNGIMEDQEYSDFKSYDRKKVRQLVEKFNKGLKR